MNLILKILSIVAEVLKLANRGKKCPKSEEEKDPAEK
jgi:hypothetical protein